MTEEVTQVENTPAENPGVNISVEQILAAVINTVGPVTVAIDKLIFNYGNQSISVNQNEDKSVTFALVDNSATVSTEESSTETAE